MHATNEPITLTPGNLGHIEKQLDVIQLLVDGAREALLAAHGWGEAHADGAPDQVFEDALTHANRLEVVGCDLSDIADELSAARHGLRTVA